MEMIRTKRGREKLIVNGYFYVFDRLSSNKVQRFWRCEERGRCKARIHTLGETVTLKLGRHSHAASDTNVKVLKAVSKSVKPTSVVINKYENDSSQTVQRSLPNFAAIKIKQYPAPVKTDVGQPVTVSSTDQVVTAVGSNDNRQNSIHPSGATEEHVSGLPVFNISPEMQSFNEIHQPRRSVKQTDMLTSQVRPSKRSSQLIEYRKWRRESAASSVGDQELGLVTDRDSMAPNSKVSKSEANVMPHAVLQEAMVFPQSTKAATQKKRTLTVPNHQVAVMSNLLSMWKAGQLCDFYISNGTTKIMVHKMVLGAVCPKMLPVLNSSYSKVTLPSYISKEGMLAFVEYMYTGVLDLNQDILVQLKTIAQRLDMKDFEQLCSSELHKAKAASFLSVVGGSSLAEPCSLSGLLPSSTQRTTDPGHFQNTTFRHFFKQFENINGNNSSNSQGVVPTGNLATVGGLSSSSSVPTHRSAPGTTTAGQVTDIKTEFESDDETILIPNSQQLKMETCSPVRNQYGIQEKLTDFENIISSSNGRGDGLPVSYSTNYYMSRSSPSSPEVIHITELRHSEDSQVARSHRGRGADISNNTGDGSDLQLVPITSVTDHCTIPSASDISVTTSINNLVSYNSDLVNTSSNMATITDLSPTTSNSVPYPVGLFTYDGSKITPALQKNCV